MGNYGVIFLLFGNSEEASVRMLQLLATKNVSEVQLHVQPARLILSHCTPSI
jgi:UDP-N-acetylglucosamine transferase subunit ALG13